VLLESSGINRTKLRCKDPGLGRIDRRGLRQAKQGILETEMSKSIRR
jgi:hypothetical protein